MAPRNTGEDPRTKRQLVDALNTSFKTIKGLQNANKDFKERNKKLKEEIKNLKQVIEQLGAGKSLTAKDIPKDLQDLVSYS